MCGQAERSRKLSLCRGAEEIRQESTSYSGDSLQTIDVEQGTLGAASSEWRGLLFAEGLDDKQQIGVCALGYGELFWVCESGIHDDESGAPGFLSGLTFQKGWGKLILGVASTL